MFYSLISWKCIKSRDFNTRCWYEHFLENVVELRIDVGSRCLIVSDSWQVAYTSLLGSQCCKETPFTKQAGDCRLFMACRRDELDVVADERLCRFLELADVVCQIVDMFRQHSLRNDLTVLVNPITGPPDSYVLKIKLLSCINNFDTEARGRAYERQKSKPICWFKLQCNT